MDVKITVIYENAAVTIDDCGKEIGAFEVYLLPVLQMKIFKYNRLVHVLLPRLYYYKTFSALSIVAIQA